MDIFRLIRTSSLNRENAFFILLSVIHDRFSSCSITSNSKHERRLTKSAINVCQYLQRDPILRWQLSGLW